MLPFSGAITTFLKIDPINCILDAEKDKGGLYLGNIFAAYDETILNQYSIGAVLTVAANTDLSYPTRKHKIVSVDDVESENLSKYFEEMIAFIDEHRNKKLNVFVHCFAGVSRSSTAIIAYLMKTNNWDFSRALALCKKKRFVTCPNIGFTRQLKAYEQKVKISSKNKPPLEQNSQALVNKVNSQQQKSFSQSGKQFDLINIKKRLYNMNDISNQNTNMGGQTNNAINTNTNSNFVNNTNTNNININNIKLISSKNMKNPKSLLKRPILIKQQGHYNVENQFSQNQNKLNINNNNGADDLLPPLNIQQKPFYSNQHFKLNPKIKNNKFGKNATAKLL